MREKQQSFPGSSLLRDHVRASIWFLSCTTTHITELSCQLHGWGFVLLFCKTPKQSPKTNSDRQGPRLRKPKELTCRGELNIIEWNLSFWCTNLHSSWLCTSKMELHFNTGLLSFWGFFFFFNLTDPVQIHRHRPV